MLLAAGGGGSEPRTGSHGVYLHNSNGMDIELWKNHLTYRYVGCQMLGPAALATHVMVHDRGHVRAPHSQD